MPIYYYRVFILRRWVDFRLFPETSKGFFDLTKYDVPCIFYILKAVEGSKKGETVLVRKKGLPKRKDSDDDSDDENDKKTTPKKLKSPPMEAAATKGAEVLSEKSQNGQKSETALSIPAGREVCIFAPEMLKA